MNQRHNVGPSVSPDAQADTTPTDWPTHSMPWAPVVDLASLLGNTVRLLDQGVERALGKARIDITSGRLRALNFLLASDAARQSDSATRMGIEPMTMSGYVDGLERQVLVRRVKDSTDRRARLIRSTEGADALIGSIEPIVGDLYDRATMGLTDAQVNLLRTVLASMSRNLKLILSGDDAGLPDPDREADEAEANQGIGVDLPAATIEEGR